MVQLEELLETLDKDDMESALFREIGDYKEEMMRQMELTEKITTQIKGNKKAYLVEENGKLRRFRI